MNIAKLLYPLEDPAMADFVNNLDLINGLADTSEGFIWRLAGEGNNATGNIIYNDPTLLVNMSVWVTIDSLFRYTYRTDHLEFFRRRKEWFGRMESAHMALWYVPAGHIPAISEAQERLTHLRDHGDTPFAFSFKRKFTPAEADDFMRLD